MVVKNHQIAVQFSGISDIYNSNKNIRSVNQMADNRAENDRQNDAGGKTATPDFAITNEEMRQNQHLFARERTETQAQAIDFSGGYPYESFDPKKYIERHATEQDKTTFSDFDKLADKAGFAKLSDSQKLQYIALPEDQKEMFKRTLKELEKFADGSISSSEYFTNTLKTAAQLAEQNGRQPGSWNIFKPTSNELYRNYVGLVFSRETMGPLRDAARDLAGSSVSGIGSALESGYLHLNHKRGHGGGYNPNVLDTDPNDTVSHHYRELMLVGYNRWKWLADRATTHLDDPNQNPGDVRNGFFASMIGDALEDGKMTPREAAEMTEWAYTKHDGTQPPWGDTGKQKSYLKAEDYDIDKWLAAFRQRG